MAARPWRNAQFSTVLIKRKRESRVEAAFNDVAGCGRLISSQARVPRVLAGVCRFVVFRRSRFSDFDSVSASHDRGVAWAFFGCACIPSKTASWIRTFSAGLECCCRGAARQVCMGIKTPHVHRIRVACCRFAVECLAAPRITSEQTMCRGCEARVEE